MNAGGPAGVSGGGLVGAGASRDLLAREAASLVARLRLWTPARFAAAALPYGTRGDLVHHLAQSLADDVGQAPVRLPRLDSDLALPDQVAVTADDLVRAGPDDATAREVTAHLLLHRAELLEEPVPAGLITALGEVDSGQLLERARARCSACIS